MTALDLSGGTGGVAIMCGHTVREHPGVLTGRAGGAGWFYDGRGGDVVASTLPAPEGGRAVTAANMPGTAETPGCGQMLELSSGEAWTLSSMLHALERVEPVVFCGLDAEHPGPHLALGQVTGAYWWWMRWDDAGTHRELVERAPCRAVTDDPAVGHVAEPCRLPLAHPGSHSYTRLT